MDPDLSAVVEEISSRIRRDIDPTWSFTVLFTISEPPLAPGWIITVDGGTATVSEPTGASSDFVFHIDGATAGAIAASQHDRYQDRYEYGPPPPTPGYGQHYGYDYGY